MTKIKFSEIITNQYTGEEAEIKGSTKEIFDRRYQEQLDKWDKEQAQREQDEYVQNKHQEAENLTSELTKANEYLNALCYYELHPLTPKSYIYEKISSIRQRHRYKPTLKDAEADVGITKLVRAAGFIPGKSKANLENLRVKAKELQKTRLEEYNKKIKEDETIYLRKRENEEKQCRHHIKDLSEGKARGTRLYYSHALDRDDYSVDCEKRYIPEYLDLKFFPETGKLRFAYRIPNSNEIFSISKYEYNEKEDMIVPLSHNTKASSEWKLRIAESVLLRAAILVFLSDPYKTINSISMIGYLRYNDDAYGKEKIKSVIRVNIPREILDEVEPENVNPVALFSRGLKAQISTGLYKREPFDIPEI